MTEVMTTTTTTKSHLETIDYKPPVSATSLDPPAHDQDRDRDHEEEDDHDDGKFDLYSEEAEWDEGGKSHCGYAESIHATLMSVGESVHSVIGEPSPRVEKELKAVGNWFQEASYAARDLLRGPQEGEEDSGMQEDALDAVKTLLRGGSKDKNTDLKGDEENTAPNDTTTSFEPMA